ncbi:Protein activity of BC1 complex kinase 8, chloroplastic [Vitis vinifera]|uniref:Protein activity of BC1 complex kinase 8, chloroplastic n=1 Tax=Vitis vinifera TaxID=29760 RepID=A0A438F4Y3_VITVI|nr:Protein activity of BC1 complex kinase 8, chloroplastic [Vitis vinifera]
MAGSSSPFPSETAISIVEEELGAPVGDIFDQFDYEPIAAAVLVVLTPVFLLILATVEMNLGSYEVQNLFKLEKNDIIVRIKSSPWGVVIVSSGNINLR